MTPPRQRRPQGTGGLFQRHEAAYGCPPLKREVDPDGTVRKVRPPHKCQGLWIGRVDVGLNPDGSRKQRTVSSKSKRVAEKKLAALKADLASGNLSTAGKTRTTVKAWADEWLPGHLADVRPSTQATDKGAVTKWIVPTLGRKRLVDLTPKDMRALRDAIVGAGRSSTTAGTYQRVFHKMLVDAVEEGHKVPQSVLAAKRAKKAASDRRDIPVEQVRAIIAAIAERPDAPRWWLSFLTGMRQAEILGLRVDHVDVDAGTLLVEWQLQQPGLRPVFPDGLRTQHVIGVHWLTETKTAHGERVLSLGPLLHAALAAAVAQWEPNPWGLLWVDAKGMPIRDYDDRAQWYAIQTSAGVAHPSGRPWYLHECRHAFVTIAKRRGFGDRLIAQAVGQSKLVEGYVHLSGSDAAPVMAAVEGVLLRGELANDEG